MDDTRQGVRDRGRGQYSNGSGDLGFFFLSFFCCFVIFFRSFVSFFRFFNVFFLFIFLFFVFGFFVYFVLTLFCLSSHTHPTHFFFRRKRNG